MVFRELPFKEYKDKAEVVDQEAKALKIGPYKPKNTKKRTNPSTSNSKQNQNSSKPKSNKDKGQTVQGSVKEGREMLRVLGKRASCKRLSQEKEREEREGEGFEINSRISRNERNPAHEPYDQFKKRRQNIPRSCIWPTRIPQSSDDFCG